MLKNLRLAIDLGLIAVLVFFVGKLANAWSPFDVPPGADALNQLQKAKYILTFWPNSLWSYQWSGGMPLLRWYPLAFHYSVAAIVYLSRSSIELATVCFLYILYFIAAAGIYAFVSKLTGSQGAGLTTSVLATISPSIWDPLLLGGVYGRVGALALLPLAMWLAVELTGSKPGERRVWAAYSALVLVLALSIWFNPYLGIPTVAVALLLVVFLQGSGRRGIGLGLKLAISVLLLSSFYLIPFFLRMPPNLSAERMGEGSLRNFFVFSRFPAPEASYLALSPVVVIFLVVMLVLSRFVKTEARKGQERKATKFLAVVTGLIFLLMVAALFNSSVVNFNDLAMPILGFVLAALAGMISFRVLTVVPRYSRYITAFLMLGLVGSMLVVSSIDPIAKISSTEVLSDPSVRVLEQLRLDNGQTLYRIGIHGSDWWVGQWWNYRSNVPQTRDYFFQGIVHPDWNAWLHAAVWEWQDNYPETNFLLDWWGVRWILVRTTDPSKFLSKPEFYKSVANVSALGTTLYEFEYNAAPPILYATDCPSALVISRDQFRNVLNGLAYAGFGDSAVVPVLGSEYVDDYSIEDLRRFDVVILYGYDYHDRAAAWELLRQYVELGGGLIIDTGYSPDSDSSLIPPPSPVEKTTWAHVGPQWDFRSVKSPVTEDIDFESFAPAVSGGAQWGVSSSEDASVRDWARPVLWSGGKPLVAVGQLGKGRVFWSGINLPWHISTYKNPVEAKFLAKAVAWASGRPYPVPKNTNYEARRDNPEKATVTLSANAGGVLFKESYYPDWKASIETADGHRQEAQILQAGTGFMYVSLPKETKYPAKVIFEFDKTIDYLGLSASAVTLVFLVAYAVVGPRASPFSRLTAALRRRMEEWELWTEEE